MRSYLVAVVDGAQARFFTLNATESIDQGQPGPHLTEHSSLNNIEKTIATKGTSHNLIGRKHHGSRHEKTTHSAETGRRFTSKVLLHIGSIAKSVPSHHLVLVAQPHMLGSLRDSVRNYVPSAMVISELAKDLCRLSAHELHKYLTTKQLLPYPTRMTGR